MLPEPERAPATRVSGQTRAMTTIETQRRLWAATIRSEGDRLASMPAERLDAPVPSVEGWTLERIVRHVGKVHRWTTGLLNAPADADPDVVAQAAPSLPRGAACLDAYREALDEMLEAFATADPEAPVASFVGRATVDFWLRRQAHEVAVHRIDAADAVAADGGPDPAPLDPVAAADGVAEWLEVFAASAGIAAEPVALEVTDVDATTHAVAWSLPPDPEGEPTASVTGPAGQLLLVVWRRRPLASVSVTGDRTRAQGLLDAVRV